MKILVVVAAACVVGCAGGVTKEELQMTRNDVLAIDAQERAKLRTDLTGIDQKFVSVQQIEMKVEKHLKEMEDLSKRIMDLSAALQTKVDLANANVLKVLEFEERLLSDRLATLRAMIEEMKKK